MSLEKCPECSHQISDKAIICPSCGLPLKAIENQPTKKIKASAIKFLILAGIIIVVMTVFRAASKSSVTNNTPSTTQPAVEDVRYEIINTFIENKMSSCRDFTYSANIGKDHEYTVKCGTNYLDRATYTVWTKTRRINSVVAD